MKPVQPFEECIIVTVKDQSKLALVMELLSHFDLVRARREKMPPALATPQKLEITSEEVQAVGSDADFWALAGHWHDRDVDASQLRQQAWKRATGNQL